MTTTPTILIDTREQTPWAFAPRFPVVRGQLPAGDYSLAGLDRHVAIERKTLDDFVRTVIDERERFWRELELLADYRFSAVVVEGGIADVLSHAYTSLAAPRAVLGFAMAIHVDMGVPVIWAGSRACAIAWAEDALVRAGDRWGAESAAPCASAPSMEPMPVGRAAALRAERDALKARGDAASVADAKRTLGTIEKPPPPPRPRPMVLPPPPGFRPPAPPRETAGSH